MRAHECYHCKSWIEEGQAHDCWSTTEAALTRDLSDDLREAWERLRETAAEFGEQRIYASLNSIMFSRTACYFFVRPRRTYLEVCVFLGREVHASQVRRVTPSSKTKFVHTIRVTHRDQVEPPLTEWLREAYDASDRLSARVPPAVTTKKSATTPKSRAGGAQAAQASARKATRRSANEPRTKRGPTR